MKRSTFMKKRGYLYCILIVVIVLVYVVYEELGNDELSYSTDNINIEITVPKGGAGDQEYRLSTDKKDLIDGEDFILIGDVVTISFTTTNHVFQENVKYEEAHGELKFPTYKQFRNFMVNDPFDLVEANVEEVNTATRAAIEYELENVVTRVLNTDDACKLPTFIVIRPVDENDSIKAIMSDDRIRMIIDSIRITGR